MRVLAIVLAALCAALLSARGASAAVYPAPLTQDGARPAYFDPHNHFTGILPYGAYANLPAFVAGLSNPHAGVTPADKLALFRFLTDTWYPKAGKALGSAPFSPPDGQRFSIGARAALVVYRDLAGASAIVLNGALERILTATPWTEFDSAYAFRGGPVSQYLVSKFYGGDYDRLQAELCKATILDLAATNVEVSEQSLPFIGGWQTHGGTSDRLKTFQCAMAASSDAGVVAALHAMKKPMPVVKFVLMTHTSQLATLPGGTTYSEWSKSGQCAPAALPPVLVTTPASIERALLGRDTDGAQLVPAAGLSAYYDTVLGIDTAGPETTCFTPEGMRYYKELAGAVYAASKARRASGWHGKLLVHTHVGEGATQNYVPAPAQPWTFRDAFSAFPPARTNVAAAQANIAALLAAIEEFQAAHPDSGTYVLFRLAHASWATPDQAAEMRRLGVEADVNLESNVATGNYPIGRMPLGKALIEQYFVGPYIENVETNFRFNDLLTTLVSDPRNVRQVGGVLGNVALRSLLENRVRCILGTDGDGVEHSDIVKEYQYAASLIAYWRRTDPQFVALAGDVSVQTLYDNARWHMRNMSLDEPLEYR